MVADGAVGDSRADLDHDAGRLVTRHEGGGHVVLAVDATQVAATHPCGHDFDADLSWCHGSGVLYVFGQAHVFLAVALLDKPTHRVPAPV